jgi:glycosyltransferase involved in cell wall biosynthesis
VTSAPVPLAVIVLTFNEEQNLEACLGSVRGWASEIHVVDSGSTDRTRELAVACGALVAEHPFETHARQWAWALDALPIASEWILALDADQRVTPELQRSIAAALAGGPSVDGYFVCRRQVFRGRWIRHGGYYPKYLLKLFRRGRGQVSADLVDHHFEVTGPTARLDGDLVEDNRNEASIAAWIDKHNRYARLQAADEIARRRQGAPKGRLFGNPDERTAWLKVRWLRLPLYLRPAMYFVYRYLFRLGFLDGREGFVFHVLQAFWYRLLVDINIEEQLRIESRVTDKAA